MFGEKDSTPHTQTHLSITLKIKEIKDCFKNSSKDKIVFRGPASKGWENAKFVTWI